MKTLISLFVVMLLSGFACVVVQAQAYTKTGKQYSPVTETRDKTPDEKSGFTWKEASGEILDIFITKNNACYVLKISKKTGKQYKKYLPKELAADIAKQLGRTNSERNEQ